MEFGSTVAYCSDVSDDEYGPGTPQKRYNDDQPRLKPSHFRSRPSQIIDGTPRLLCAEDDKSPASDFTLSLQLPPGYQPGLRSRTRSDGFLLSEAVGPATDLSVTPEDPLREPLVSPPPSDGGKRDKKRNRLKRTTALFIPKGIMKKLGKKKREHSVHVKWDDDDDEGERIPRVHQLTDSRHRRPKPKRVHMVHDAPRANTNVIAVRYSTLANPVQVHTGDSVVCRNDRCTAVLSHLSKTRLEEKPKAEAKLWRCEFCGTEQEVELALEEVPSASDTTYMVAPPPLGSSGAQGGEATMEDSLVVFCIDTSGSMGVTTPVPGKLNLRGRNQLQSLSVLNSENVTQYMPHERRDITYVSQLQSVQAAVDQQLDSLLRSQPTHRVALITFNDEVSVIGDGRGQEVVVAGDRLDNPNALARISTQLPLPSTIRHSRDILSRKLLALEESGQTALGPALQLSVLLAARVAGSRVIICTDGLANKGVGSLDVSKADETFASAQVFYKDLGDIAMENGVTVSLVTIKGTECRVLELGQVADRTGGWVNIVDPQNIATEFSNILANPILATNVVTKIILHKDLYILSEDSTAESVLSVPVGNVTVDTELSYDYAFRNIKKQDGKKAQKDKDGAMALGTSCTSLPLMVNGKAHLPFQLQIDYTTVDGTRYLKVITKSQPVSTDRNAAVDDVDVTVVGAHSARRIASLAAEGKITEARQQVSGSERLLERVRNSSEENRRTSSRLMDNMAHLDSALRRKEETMVRATLETPAVEVPSFRGSFNLAVPGRISSKSSTESSTISMPSQRLVTTSQIDDDLASEIFTAKRTSEGTFQNRWARL